MAGQGQPVAIQSVLKNLSNKLGGLQVYPRLLKDIYRSRNHKHGGAAVRALLHFRKLPLMTSKRGQRTLLLDLSPSQEGRGASYRRPSPLSMGACQWPGGWQLLVDVVTAALPVPVALRLLPSLPSPTLSQLA